LTQNDTPNGDAMLFQLLRRRVSRSQALKAAGIGAALALTPKLAGAQTTTAAAGTVPPSVPVGPNQQVLQFPFYPQVQGSYTPEDVRVIVNVAQTMEYLATTLVEAAVRNAGTIGITGLALGALQAALVEEVAHVQFLAAMGAVPMTTTFTLPDPAILTNYQTFFRNLEILETICNAAYMTANREFAELGQPLLAKFAYQAGSVEGEHRVAARTALALQNVADAIPPNNKAFETDHFLYMLDAARAVAGLGFIGGTGTALPFPGTTAALATAGATAQTTVIQKLPNNATTSSTAATDFRAERPGVQITSTGFGGGNGAGSGSGGSS
jgi:Ferritin-like domain